MRNMDGIEMAAVQVGRILRKELEDQMRSAQRDWELERQSLLAEIASLRGTVRSRQPQSLSREIAQTEAELSDVQQQVDTLLQDPNSPVGQVVQASAREAELQAYLKGLRFSAGSFSREPNELPFLLAEHAATAN
jgi:chromosome segregation ATPase